MMKRCLGLAMGIALLGACSGDQMAVGDGGVQTFWNGPWKYDVNPVGELGINENPKSFQNVCGQAEFALKNQTPDMFLLLDRSNSMADSVAGSTKSLWEIVRESINNITADLDSRILFGATVFPNAVGKNTCSRNDSDNNCSGANEQPLVPINLNNGPAIKAALQNQGNCGGTPTAVSLNAVYRYLQKVTDANPKYLLLATDGMPNCNSAFTNGCACTCSDGLFGNASSCCGGKQPLMCLDDNAALQAIDALKKAGINTYVIGLGTKSGNPAVLSKMAQIGGTGDYIKADEASKIKQAFEQIAGAIANCMFDVDCAGIQDSKKVNFYFDEEVVDQDLNNLQGWNWTKQCETQSGKGAIGFFGAACERIKNHQVQKISAKFGCKDTIY